MNNDDLYEMHEMMIAKQISHIIPELKLVDPADLIAYIHGGNFANISDIIDTATELHFYPQTMKFRNGASYNLNWDSPPTISLDMEFSNDGVTAYFRLIMSHDGFGVELENVVFDRLKDQKANMCILLDALENARLKKTQKQ